MTRPAHDPAYPGLDQATITAIRARAARIVARRPVPTDAQIAAIAPLLGPKPPRPARNPAA